MNANSMRVLVADDHSLFRDGIVSLLEAAGFDVVGQVGNGEEAIEVANLLNPDLILLDITMPKMSGLEALKRIRLDHPDVKVVMLTVSDDDQDILTAIRAGANGYLLKNLTSEDFLDLLNGLGRGEAAMTGQTTARLIQGLGKQASPEPSPYEKLTAREIELLRLVANGLSNRAIAQELAISENTVKYHMKNIFQKLDAQNRAEAVTHGIQAGLLDT
ncbi:MAG: response regulator [Anaerolineales bacterium]|nr:response regulator [Anaerolineales bacterium]